MSNDKKKSRDQSIEELSLMLLYLTRFPDSNEFSRYLEPSWTGYDFGVLEKLEEEELLYRQRKSKIGYLSKEGKARARILLKEYNIVDREIMERFEFRNINPDETDQVIAIEQACFPPNEACSPKAMTERIAVAPELFLVAVDKSTGRIAGFLNGLSTDEFSFRDAFFTDASLYDAKGKNIMLLGLDVLPEYRRQGLAREIMYQYLRREREKGRHLVLLTCHQSKIKMYKKMGFSDQGISSSSWGGEQWHEMCCVVG
jgi:ribosomal protein S18 acetylase RimI-like enzyme